MMKIIICGLIGLIIGIGIGYLIWGEPVWISTATRISTPQTTGNGKFISFNLPQADTMYITSTLLGSGKKKATEVRKGGGGPQAITTPDGLRGLMLHVCTSDSSTAGWMVTTSGDYRINPYLDALAPCGGSPPTNLHFLPPVTNSYDVTGDDGRIYKVDTYLYDCGGGDKTQITIMMVSN